LVALGQAKLLEPLVGEIRGRAQLLRTEGEDRSPGERLSRLRAAVESAEGAGIFAAQEFRDRHAPCEAVDAREEHDAGALAVLGQDPGAAKRRSRRGGERHELVEGEKLDSLWLEVVVQAEHLDRAEMGERG